MKAGGYALYGNLEFFLLSHTSKRKSLVWEGLSKFLSFYYFLTNRFSFKPLLGLVEKIKKVKSAVAHLFLKLGSKKNEIFCICNHQQKKC